MTTASALKNYERYSKELTENGGRILSGGKRLAEGELTHGYFVAPTLAEAPATHPLFKEEMFVPITMVCRVRDRAEAIRLANDSRFGLTAGLYGNDDDAAYFFDNIEAGVTYVNRPQGATTGAWPGYQPFGGWKGSGSSGKGHRLVLLSGAIPARTIADKSGIGDAARQLTGNHRSIYP